MDLHCRIDWANDVLEGVARIIQPSALSSNDSGPVVVAPGTGELRIEGFAPTVLIRPA